ncbi:hypothetical protein CBR_g23589 [Chara braunii]|uniref:Protein kinase domain-containing protein n=1 Tax=Chara braunii TaxID=69332 RepID=A0A388L4M9_CHABU|nr:hypothetical protein CBR_g23589 [Chara braunii]|eukprot:GBG77261.1 hypothetical protein CBR_g23589 [Chara braunii]
MNERANVVPIPPSKARCEMAQTIKQFTLPNGISGKQIIVHHSMKNILVLDLREATLSEPAAAHLLRWVNWGAVFTEGSRPRPGSIDEVVSHLQGEAVGFVPTSGGESQADFWIVDAHKWAATLPDWHWARVFAAHTTDGMANRLLIGIPRERTRSPLSYDGQHNQETRDFQKAAFSALGFTLVDGPVTESRLGRKPVMDKLDVMTLWSFFTNLEFSRTVYSAIVHSLLEVLAGLTGDCSRTAEMNIWLSAGPEEWINRILGKTEVIRLIHQGDQNFIEGLFSANDVSLNSADFWNKVISSLERKSGMAQEEVRSLQAIFDLPAWRRHIAILIRIKQIELNYQHFEKGRPAASAFKNALAGLAEELCDKRCPDGVRSLLRSLELDTAVLPLAKINKEWDEQENKAAIRSGFRMVLLSRSFLLQSLACVLLLATTSKRVNGAAFKRPVLGQWSSAANAPEPGDSQARLLALQVRRNIMAMVSTAPPSSPPVAESEGSMTLLQPELFVPGNQSVVPPIVVHTPSPDFQTTARAWSCFHLVRDFTFHPNGSEMYFILDKFCNAEEQVQTRRLSIRKADLGRARQGFKNSSVLSYWWQYGAGNGLSETSDFVWRKNIADNISMAFVYSLDVNKEGDQLVTGARPGIGTQSRVVWLSTATGERTSVEITADFVWSVAFNPKKTELFISDVANPVRILSMAVTDFLPDESCLYFADWFYDRVWGIDPRSPSARATLVAGSGQSGSVDGDGPKSQFDFVATAVATPDGCNVFVTEHSSGFLRWLKLDAPCSSATSVQKVGRYSAAGLWGLALRQTGSELRLFVGADDGSVFELTINNSQLHSCAPTPPLVDPTSSPAPADMPSSSGPSPSGPSAVVPTSRGTNLGLAVGLPLSISAFLALATCLSVLVYRARRNGGKQPNAIGSRTLDIGRTSNWTTEGGACQEGGRGGGLHPLQVRRFELAALQQCTADFSKEYRIGEKGAFGEVYWGSIDDQDLAIKVMTGDLTEGKRSMFLAEVNTLSRLHHANLSGLVGFCDEGSRSILVYPYFPGGSLYARLHHREKAVPGRPRLSPLTLVERMCIAWQIARGLSYLHGGADPPVIHRDIKSSNVLLGDGAGDKLRVVLADFGLATIGERVFGGTTRDTAVKTSHVGGTFGYMAPEYVMSGILSEKIDVYAFGVILLELLTGRKAVTEAPSGNGSWQTLVDWARPFLRSEFIAGGGMPQAILDSCLRDEVAGRAFQQMTMEALRLASNCLMMEPAARPTMTELAEKLGDLLIEAQVNIRRV